MKVINSVPKKKQSFAIAKFSKLLGCELALSNYTGTCIENAEKEGCEEMAVVFTKNHEELKVISNAIAGLAIVETENSSQSMEEFVSGADFLEKQSGLSGQPNMAEGLKNAHNYVIGIIEKEILPFLNPKKNNEVDVLIKSLLFRHRGMINALENLL